MGTMNFGYYYDYPKEGNNEYSLEVDGIPMIPKGTYHSVLRNFNADKNYHEERNIKNISIVMKKIYDKKTGDCDIIIRKYPKD
ncbi:MAG: hypothetical protein N4A62_21130 [Marinisporobacter sp.]|jgi:hypothetical protein|nr:hypothetical protein [Marinisporobacter sp.]